MIKSTLEARSISRIIPVISVIMPVFNAERYLAEAIESILSQTHGRFEFLIFDDGSIDGSRMLIQKYALKDSRIKLEIGEHRGYAYYLQRGIGLAEGQYIARMDADDVSLPCRFDLQVKYMDQHPECVAVGGQALRIDADGDIIGPHFVPESHKTIDGHHMRKIGGQIIHPNAMLRTGAVRQVCGYRPEFEPAEDFDLFLRLAEMGCLANLPDVTLKFRMHLKSVTHTKIRQQGERSQAALIEAHQRRGLKLSLEAKEENNRIPSATDIAWSWVRIAYKSGNFGTARKYAKRYIWRDPFRARSWWLLIGSMLGSWAQPIHRMLKREQTAYGQN